MRNTYVLAHDLGTSGDKACLFDSQCRLLGTSFTPYKTYFPHEGWAEQDPEEWWSAVCMSSKKVITEAGLAPEDISAISFSAQSSGCLPIDCNGKPLRERAIIWMDTRSTEQASYLADMLGADTQYSITGNGLATVMLPCSKIMWIREHQPEVWQQAAKYIGCKEYLIGRMTGVFGVTDFTEAQSSGVFSALDKCYDSRLLSLTGIPEEKLCRAENGTAFIGTVLPAAANELGVSTDTKVILGMMDNPAAAVGAGCFKPGVFVASLGTAAWLGCVDEKSFINAKYHVNSTYLGFGKYRSSVNSHTVGAALDWGIKNLLGLDGADMYDEASVLAARCTPGAAGVMFLPSFRIGNCRYSSPGAAGALIGMKLEHGREHVARALFESLAYELHIGLDFFSNNGAAPCEIRLIGGGSRNQLQAQIISDVLGIPVLVPENSRHIGSSGAAMLALVGSGNAQNIDAVTSFKTASRYEPDKGKTAFYAKSYERYKQCYEALMPVYDSWNKKDKEP